MERCRGASRVSRVSGVSSLFSLPRHCEGVSAEADMYEAILRIEVVCAHFARLLRSSQ